MSYNVRIFENNKENTFDNFSGQELDSITNYLSILFDIDDTDIDYVYDTEKNYDICIIKNVDENTINEFIDRKFDANLKQYGVNPWNNVQLLITKI